MSALPTPLLTDPERRARLDAQLESLRVQLAAAPRLQGTSQALQQGTFARSVPQEQGQPFAFEQLAGRLVELLDPLRAPRLTPTQTRAQEGRSAQQGRKPAAATVEDPHAHSTTSALDGRTSWAAARVAEAQARGETAAWIVWEPRGIPYPPDLAAVGIDLLTLPIIRAVDGAAVLKAADLLLRSGAFGLVIADWPAQEAPPGDGPLGRLLGLCQKHDAALLVLSQPPPGTHESQPGLGDSVLGSLASLRLAIQRKALPDGEFQLRVEVLKDKRRGHAGPTIEERTAPEGLGAGAKRL